jgi:hypothetical protein
MAVRSTMSSIINRVRVLINDPIAAVFADQVIQDVLDSTRQDARYLLLAPAPTYSASLLLYLDYFSPPLTDWEDDLSLWQYRVTSVSPATSDNIVGHWTFSLTTLPPVYLIGKTYDVYRAAADLIERQAMMWAVSFNVTADGQTFQQSQVVPALLNVAKQYRMKQRPITLSMIRTDLVDKGSDQSVSLAPIALDYFGSGDGR